jgi:F-type H+/Na+-transporting ATPase subunit alpha
LQPQYSPYGVWEQTAMLLAANEGIFDAVPVADIRKAADALLAELKRSHKKLVDTLNEGDKPTDKMREDILNTAKKVAKEFEAKAK